MAFFGGSGVCLDREKVGLSWCLVDCSRVAYVGMTVVE
jgi:hypothetical protein